jgi:hypothetical protein
LYSSISFFWCPKGGSEKYANACIFSLFDPFYD